MKEVTFAWASRLKYWAVHQFGHEIHVVPMGDWQEHRMDELCKCEPTKKTVAISTMYVHNSFDGREQWEK